MVDKTFDPVRIPAVMYSPAELKEIDDEITAGRLPEDYLDKYFDGLDANVFGADAPKDRKGNRQEQGLGSPGNQTQQSIDAYIKNQTERRVGGPEPDFLKNLEVMRAQLADCSKQRVASGPTSHLRNYKRKRK